MTRHNIPSRILQRLTQDEGRYGLTQDLVDHIWTMRDLKEPSEPEKAVNWNIRKLRSAGHQIAAKRGAGSPGYMIAREQL